MRLEAAVDRGSAPPGARAIRYVRLRAEAPPLAGQRTPASLALVLDRSRSMAGERLELAKHAAARMLAALAPGDRFAIIVYDHHLDILAASTPATDEAKAAALARLAPVAARGTTDLAAGLGAGCVEVARGLSGGAIGRCLLITDGVPTEGIIDERRLVDLAVAWRRRGVATSTFGLGAEFDEHLLQAIADAAGGRFRFLDAPARVPEAVAAEVEDSLAVVGREATIEVEAPAGVGVAPLTALPHQRRAAGLTVVELGDLAAGQRIDLVVEVDLPPGPPGERVRVRCRLRDASGEGPAGSGEVVFAVAPVEAPRDEGVALEVARLLAARAHQQALSQSRAGDHEAAASALRNTALEIASYAAGDPYLAAVAGRLEGESAGYARPLDAAGSKLRHSMTASALRMRDATGRPLGRAGGDQGTIGGPGWIVSDFGRPRGEET